MLEKEDFIKHYDLDASDWEHIPEGAEIMTWRDFADLEDAIVEDTKREVARFEPEFLPIFSHVEVDDLSIQQYVDSLREDEYVREGYGSLEFWWKV